MSEASKLLHLTDENFTLALQEHAIILVDFWASWCGPCKRLQPVLEELAQEFSGKVAIGKINIEENQSIPTAYHIMSLPTLILFHTGEEKDRRMGFETASALGQWIRSKGMQE